MSSIWNRSKMVIVLLLCLLWIRGAGQSPTSPSGAPNTQSTQENSGRESPHLLPGTNTEREIKGGEQHRFQLTLKANDLLSLTVEQRGADVEVRLVGPDGTVVQVVQSASGRYGPELLSLIARTAGTYRIEIVSRENPAYSGRYEFRLEPLRAATVADQVQIDIERLLTHAEVLQIEGNYDQALKLTQQARTLAENRFAADHLLTAKCLNLQAGLLRVKGDYAQAENLFGRALEIRETKLGQDSLEVAQSLNGLAGLYRAKGEYARALPLFARGLAIREKKLEPNHPDIAQSLNNLAVLYRDKGEYDKAEPLLVRALAIQEQGLKADDLDIALGLNNLAGLYRATGRYPQAEPLYLKSLAIREQALGPDHRDVAQSLSNLAVLYRAQAEYTKAEPLYVRALAIQEKALGPDHLDVALTLNNLAGFYLDKGADAKAEPLYLKSLAIREKALGPDHLDVGVSLHNLSVYYLEKGDVERAEPLSARSLAIRLKALGADHPVVATAYSHLANLSQAKGALTEAESLYAKALAIFEKALGPEHPSVAVSLTNLARFYRTTGKFAQAESLFIRALAIQEKALGTNHPLVAKNLSALADLYLAQGNPAKAIANLTLGNEVTERDLLRNLVAGSEHQKTLYLKQTEGYTDQTISLQVQAAPTDPEALRAALTVVLRRKGRALDAMTNALAILQRNQRPETQKLLAEYADLAGQISFLTLRGPGKKKPEEHLTDIRSLEEQKEKLENDISRRSAEFKAQATPITVEGVQKLIPADSVLVEYAVYRPYDPQTTRFGPPRYVAYVLKPAGGTQQAKDEPDNRTETEKPSPATRHPLPTELCAADLGPVEPIDRAVASWRKAIGNPKQEPVRPGARALERLVLKPLRRYLGTASHLLISPDGALNLIPFSALVDDRGKYLVETYNLTYVTSGRDLLRLEVKLPSNSPALVLADPDYAAGTGPMLAGHQFQPLQPLLGSGREGRAIQKLLVQATVKLRAEATKRELQNVQRPQLLHVATHGYFMDTTSLQTEAGPTRNIVKLDAPEVKNVAHLLVENPLLRSFLFFAGANHSGTADNDGIMTALEVAQLDLWGTELVVLSACDTGLGEVRNGDGVYGLRRALVLAGSEAHMMSLWAVSDQGTRELMIEYYTRLKAGEGRSEALRHTQLMLLKNPLRRHPYYWASFIQSGAWTELEAK